MQRKNKKILFIGASAWIARCCIASPLAEKYEIITLSRSKVSSGARHYQGAALNYDFLKKTLKKERPDLVVNFVGVSLPDDRLNEMVELNVGVSVALIRALNDLSLSPELIFMGSAAEYGNIEVGEVDEASVCNPVSGYGLTKWNQTLFVQAAGAQVSDKVCVLRPFNIIGRGMPSGGIGYLLWQKVQMMSTGEVELYYPSIERDFVDIEDLVAAIFLLIDKIDVSGIYNVSSGRAYEFSTVIEKMAAALKSNVSVYQDPAFVSIEPPIRCVVGNSNRLKSECNWMPQFDLDDSIRRLANL